MIPRMVLALLLALATPAMRGSVHKMAQPDTRLRMIESLPGARTATDSITLLYNIYDLSSGAAADSAAKQIYRVARANRYDEVALDILRDMAQVHSDNDSILARIQTIAENEFPESNLQKETIIFVKIYRTYLETAYTPEKKLKEKIRQIISRYGGSYSTDPYERLMQQFLQCIFISHETQGTLLNQYINALERQLRNIPRQSDKLTARLYRQKAYSYTVNSDYNRAVEADRKLLELYDKIERVNAAQGRPYRNLDRFRLGSLTRMLSNYPALNVGEADSIYLAINHIKAKNPSLQSDRKTDQAKIFVDMAHGNYAAALEPLRALAATELDHIERRHLLKQLMIAAENCGREDVLLEASASYARQIEAYIDSKMSECLRELQIIFDVDRLRTDSVASELQIQNEVGHRRTLMLKIMVALAMTSAALLVTFIILYRRFRRLSEHLKTANKRLITQHEELHSRSEELRAAIAEATYAEQQKASFIRYISSTLLLPLHSLMEYSQKLIDSSRGDAKPFLQRFGEVVRENSEQLQNFAARLLRLSRQDHDTD
ncbi:MAG: hypothetical protein K2L32_06620 [Muribaculaceae bacterium]|nr:hypothetical protein [Muribaculaceae bacterium]